MSCNICSIFLSSPDETAKLARIFAGMARPGDVFLLEGGIGAGKTHFARSFIQSLLATPEDIPSPTFTLVQIYETNPFEIWHADLYRLTSPDEVVELGLEGAFEEAVCLVEWPDRLAELAPENAVTMSFGVGEQEGHRTLTLCSKNPQWVQTIKAMTK